jgi:hypothetical protein
MAGHIYVSPTKRYRTDNLADIKRDRKTSSIEIKQNIKMNVKFSNFVPKVVHNLKK